MNRITFGLLMISLLNCSAQRDVSSTSEPIVELRTTACFGRCPVYHLQIFPDQQMILKGESNLEQLGTFRKALSERQYHFIVDAFNELDFAGLKAVYDGPVSDISTTYVTYRPDRGREKTVKARFDYPDALAELIKMLKSLVQNSDGWLAVRNDQDANVLQDQIIVHLQPSVDVAHFLESYAGQSLRQVRVISEEKNLFLLTFDVGSIDPSAMLSRIRHDERVIHAEFDRKLDIRR